MKRLTQDERILRHLQDYGSITSWCAIEEYGITRLSAKIYNLKADGYKIEGEMVKDTNRYGESVSYKRYELVGDR